MIYKMLPKLNADATQIFARIDEDGKCRLTCSQDDANFKKEILADEAQLQDADGNVMADAKNYVASLP